MAVVVVQKNTVFGLAATFGGLTTPGNILLAFHSRSQALEPAIDVAEIGVGTVVDRGPRGDRLEQAVGADIGADAREILE